MLGENLNPANQLDKVLQMHYYQLRNYACNIFEQQSKMVAGNDQDPFILWPVINREPKPWLPVLLARVALYELQNHLFSNNPLIIIGVPASATWYADCIQESGLFPNAVYPQVLKQAQIDNLGIDATGALVLPVPSYVHNRDPVTGKRNTQDIYILNPGMYDDATLLIMDDAIAQGTTIEFIAAAAKKQLNVHKVLIASPMAKDMQGGLELLRNSKYVDGFSVLINVIQTHGIDGPIVYKSTHTETKS